MKKVVIALIFALLTLLHCDLRKVDKSEMVGKYLATHHEGIDSLILDKDGKYRVYFHPYNKQQSYEDAGDWAFYETGNDQDICFKDVNVKCDFPGHTLLDGSRNRSVYLPIEAFTSSDSINIIISRDWGYYYVKQ